MEDSNIALHDNAQEELPLVDEEGTIVGTATRGECHSGTMWLHPVVHLHVYDRSGRLYLQHRPLWKDIQPGKWDTAVGGHMNCNETPFEALEREAYEELGISGFEAKLLTKYVYTSDKERELIYVFRTEINEQPIPTAELDGGRFFTFKELNAQVGKNFFTPNFEWEWTQVLPEFLEGLTSLEKCQ